MTFMLDSFRQDLRYALRGFARAPLFAAASVASLGIAIAVAVAIYSIVNAVLFRPMAAGDPAGLVEIVTTDRDGSAPFGRSSYDDLEDYRRTAAFSDIAAEYAMWTKISSFDLPPEYAGAAVVTPNYFDVLRVRLAAGHSFSRSGGEPEAILSADYARRIGAIGAKALGGVVRIAGMPHTVIGIAPAGFHGVRPFGNTAVWLPRGAAAVASAADPGRTNRRWEMYGRLAPEVTQRAAQARIDRVASLLATQYPRAWKDYTKQPLRLVLLSPHERMMKAFGRDLPKLLATIGAFVAIILILACTNVAGLLLARAVTRRHEIAVRITLGANMRRIMAQLLLESVMLALAGGALGTLFAHIGLTLAARNPIVAPFAFVIDWRVAVATFGTSLLCALAFGLTPAVQTLRASLKSGLRGHSVIGERADVRGRLIALQVSLAFMLIVLGFTAGNGIRSEMRNVADLDLDNVVVIQNASFARDSLAIPYARSELDILRGMNGVTSAVAADQAPLEGYFGDVVSLESPRGRFVAGIESVDADYFSTVGMRLLRGRVPHSGDLSGLRPTIIVNRAFAGRYDRDVVGTTVRLSNDRQAVIAGVADVEQQNLKDGETQPYIYEIRAQSGANAPAPFILVRVKSGAAREVNAGFSAEMRARHPDVIPPKVDLLRTRMEAGMAPQRYIAKIVSGVGFIQLFVASIGLYSLLLYAALSRTREIGLRMALGARASQASLSVMRDAMLFVAAGAVFGAMLGAPAAFFGARIFVGAHAGDPIAFLAAGGGIALALTAAAYVPMRRAARVQPMAALRQD